MSFNSHHFKMMKQVVNTCFVIACLLLLNIMTISAANAAAQSEELELKAAFIYNFSLLTTWPEAKENLNFCVLGESGYVGALAKYEGRKVANATIHVQKINAVEEANSCEILFIGSSENPRMEHIHSALKGMPVLTVAELGILDPPGVMITLVRAGNRVAFEVNHHSAKSAGLDLSSKMLKLARKVK